MFNPKSTFVKTQNSLFIQSGGFLQTEKTNKIQQVKNFRQKFKVAWFFPHRPTEPERH